MSFGDGTILLGVGEGKTVHVLVNPHTLKLVREEGSAAYSLVETTIVGDGPPLHIHKAEEEAFYVLDGEVNVRLGDRTVKGKAGSFVFIPRGTIHTFSNARSTPAKLLQIFSPPGFEQFFEEIDGLSDLNEIIAIAPKYGMEIVGPPLGA